MKLIMAIISDDDAYKVMDMLNEQKFQVTKLASTGGFLKSGNTTLICGVEEEKVDEVIAIVKEYCKPRKEIVPAGADNHIQMATEVNVGGATIFVMEVGQFIKV